MRSLAIFIDLLVVELWLCLFTVFPTEAGVFKVHPVFAYSEEENSIL